MKTKEQKIIDTIKNTMVGLGMYETYTYSFTSEKVFDKLLLDKDSELRNNFTISNPLGEDFKVMRTTTIPEILKVMAHNYNRRVMDGMFF